MHAKLGNIIVWLFIDIKITHGTLVKLVKQLIL